MGFTVKVEIPNAKKTFNRIFDKPTKIYALTRLRAYTDPYIAFDTGMLAQNVETTEEYNHYKSPYASKVWNGENMNFSKDKHPLATAHPERAAMAAKGQQLADDITAYIKRK